MVEIYDAVVVGSGPVGVIMSLELLKQGKKVLNIDAGSGIKYLQSLMKLNSNLNYTGIEKLPSLNSEYSNYVWGEGCIGWHDFSKKYDSHTMPYLPIKESLFEKHQIKIAKIVADPYLLNIINELEKDNRYTHISNTLMKSIKLSEFNLELTVLNYPSFNSNRIITKELFLAAGTLENTKFLIKNSKELGLNSNSYLGKNLSDHYFLNISKIFSINFTKLVNSFYYKIKKNGTRLWPRVRLVNQNHIKEDIRSFAYFTEFSHTRVLPKIIKIAHLEKLPKFSKVFLSERRAILNLFVEASNQNTNEIEISSDDDIIPSMNINFNISNEEISSINRISLDFSNCFTS